MRTLGGAVTCAYSGTAPTAGWNKLSADGNGGVKSASAGVDALVICVNGDGTAVICL